MVLVTGAAILITLVYTIRTGISPVPTSPRVRASLMATLPDELEGPVFELGSGWGTLAFPLARAYPQCPVEAYELSPVPWLVSLLRQLLTPCPNLTIHRQNFHRADLGQAALVVCYLYPGGMAGLRKKFESELSAGSFVVSNFFAVPGWTPAEVRRANDLYRSPVYVYRVWGGHEKADEGVEGGSPDDCGSAPGDRGGAAYGSDSYFRGS